VIVNSDIESYIIDIIDPEEALLYELERETYVKVLNPRMVTGHWQGQILKMISSMIKPQAVLEIGTFTGYSAICFAKGLAPEGHIHTIEINDEIVHIPEKYFTRAGISDKVTIHIGDALEIIPTLNVMFDLVFIDGDKSQYLDYYHIVFDKVKPGGYILADNILWNGKVVESVEPGDYSTKGILEFNNYIKNDKRVEKTILPVRDGTLLIRKK
jgi:predicted O-methyltransferase YrrM